MELSVLTLSKKKTVREVASDLQVKFLIRVNAGRSAELRIRVEEDTPK